MALKTSTTSSFRHKVAFYVGNCLALIAIANSLIFFETKWWQLVGMIGIALLHTALLMCYRCKYCYDLLKTQTNKSYFLRFYLGVEELCLIAFCFFCPIFIEYS